MSQVSEFERGDNLGIRLVFSVSRELNLELQKKWASLGIKKVTDPQGGGHYYDSTLVNTEEYSALIRNFIVHIGLSGQNVHITGELP